MRWMESHSVRREYTRQNLARSLCRRRAPNPPVARPGRDQIIHSGTLLPQLSSGQHYIDAPRNLPDKGLTRPLVDGTA